MAASSDRALLLIEQKRFELAEQELRQALAVEPDDAMAHALLGLCLMHRKQLNEATRQVEEAIRLAPDSPFGYWTQAHVLSARNRDAEAERAAVEAVRLNPENPTFYGLLAAIQLDRGHWQDALRSAEEGLRLDPQDVECTNWRAMALVKLGRRDEADRSLDTALAQEPENAVTHANRGWAQLHRGQSREALESFRESLRLDPESAWAKEGLVEALKARYPIYGQLLRYFLWMSTLSPRARWGVIIGGYVVSRLLGPLVILWIAFCILTWVADPLFNLLLRFNRFGRYALSDDQIRASNLVAACLGGAALTGLLAVALESLPLGALTGVLLVLIVPVAATFTCTPGWPRTVMGGYTAVLAALGLVAVIVFATSSATGNTPLTQVVGTPLIAAFIIGAIVSTWIAAGLSSVRPER